VGPVNWLAVVLGTVAFFVVGAVWYGALFGQAWRHLSGVREVPRGAAMVRIVALTLLAEFFVATTLGHQFARTSPPDHVKLMMAFGFALFVMTPAIAISYLHQRRPLALFLIDAGHFVFGMLAMGAVFVALG
jgi:hypothetical protein